MRGIYPGFPFCHPGRTSIIRPTSYIGAVFLISSTPSDSGGPGSSPPRFFLVRKSVEVPDFKRFLRHLSVSFPPSLGLLSCRAAYPVGPGSATCKRVQGLRQRPGRRNCRSHRTPGAAVRSGGPVAPRKSSFERSRTAQPVSELRGRALKPQTRRRVFSVRIDTPSRKSRSD